jgi:hypothetical protein
LKLIWIPRDNSYAINCLGGMAKLYFLMWIYRTSCFWLPKALPGPDPVQTSWIYGRADWHTFKQRW